MDQHFGEYTFSEKRARKRKVFLVVFQILTVFILINLCIKYVIFPVRQNSDSMIPDVSEKSIVMVCPLLKTPKRGDLVFLNSKAAEDSSFLYKAENLLVSFFTFQQKNLSVKNEYPGTANTIRRVVGMPGDTFYMRDYVMYIKPAGEKHYLTEFEITSEPYNVTFAVQPAFWDSTIGVKGFSEEYTLKDNEYFVLADNRFACSDSRLSGPVTLENINGRVLFCYFPFMKFKVY